MLAEAHFRDGIIECMTDLRRFLFKAAFRHRWGKATHLAFAPDNTERNRVPHNPRREKLCAEAYVSFMDSQLLNSGEEPPRRLVRATDEGL